MVQDNVPGTALENRVAEVNVLTGQVIQSYQIGNLFNVSYGDLEGAENGNLYVVSSVEDSIIEITTQVQLVQRHDLPSGVSNLSGFDFDCGGAAVCVCNTSGVVYHLGQSNCNSATGISTVEIARQVLTVYPNPSEGVFRFNRELEECVVFDVLGHEVLRTMEKSAQLDMHSFSNGIYLLRTSGGVTARLVKY